MRNQDRAAHFEHRSGLVIVVADGAGGSSGGEAAAELLLRSASAALAKTPRLTSESCARALESADAALLEDGVAGESTGVIVVVGGEYVFGASVGDSEARLVHVGKKVVLTENQVRKPLLGSGAALPCPFGPVRFGGTLVVGTDGLFNFATPSAILAAADLSDVEELAASLVEEVRLPSGAFRDDVTVVLCRLAARTRFD